MNIDYNETIPNNVDLGDDRRLLRALERWQPAYIEWWKEMGPVQSDMHKIYLRTAVSVDTDGWAHFDYVTCPNIDGASFSTSPKKIARSALARTRERMSGQIFPASTAANFVA